MSVLSLLPGAHSPVRPFGWDKFNHFAAYALLALLLLGTVAAVRTVTWRLRVAIWLASCAFGLLIEMLQGAMAAGRQWEVGDLLANALGALAACVIFRQVHPRSLPHEP